MVKGRQAHELGQAHLYNDPDIGVTDAATLAGLVDYIVGTPERRNGDPKRSGPREEFWREVKKHNPDLEIAAYTTSNSAMLADKGAYSNQPFHDGEFKTILAAHPNVALRDPAGNVLYKGSVPPPLKMAVVNPGYSQPILYDAHVRNFNEIWQRAGDVFSRYFVDDWGDITRVFKHNPEVMPTQQYGHPEGEAWWKMIVTWYKLHRSIAVNAGVPFSANIGGLSKFTETRFRTLAAIASEPINGVPGEVMIEHLIGWNEQWPGAEYVEDQFKKAQIVGEAGGRALYVLQLDPRYVAEGQRLHESMRFGVIAAQIFNNGFANVRVADSYTVFEDVPLIRQIGTITGPPKTGEAGKVRNPGPGQYERAFENATLKVNTKTRAAEIIEAPIIVKPDPEEPETPGDPIPETPEPAKPALTIVGTIGTLPINLAVGFDTAALKPLIALAVDLLRPPDSGGGGGVRFAPTTITEELVKG